jgi:hypothetical protein
MTEFVSHDDDRYEEGASPTESSRVAEIFDSYLMLAQRVSYLEAVTSQMQNDLDVLDERQSNQLAIVDAERSDASDGRHVSHLEVGRRYASFVEQDLFGLAREEVSGYRSRSPRREWIPRIISSMCAELFRVGCDPDLRVKSGHGYEALNHAADIRAMADRAGLSYHWDFYFKVGRQLDDKWQQAWGRCDSAHPVKFIVAPAYVVDGMIYHRQWVYTAPRISAEQ